MHIIYTFIYDIYHMRAFIDLSLKNAPHKNNLKSWNLLSWEATFPPTSGT
jgi:hypothetical protein